jgi:hypothetical protein
MGYIAEPSGLSLREVNILDVHRATPPVRADNRSLGKQQLKALAPIDSLKLEFCGSEPLVDLVSSVREVVPVPHPGVSVVG